LIERTTETTMAEPAPKITYTTLGSSEEFHAAFDAAAQAARAGFGALWPASIGGRPSRSGRAAEVRSPIDRRLVVARVEQASAEEAATAVDIADAAFPTWRDLGWEARAAILRRAAEEIVARKYESAALMAYEVGKNRLEAMGEVEESADLLRYYAACIEEQRGFRRPMARLVESESTESVLLPYGVFGVVAPFNFPMALAAGMIGAALLAGNVVVFKPSSEAPLSGALLCEALWAAGVPRDVLHFLPGAGAQVGEAILEHPRTQGMAFTGSYDVGMRIWRGFATDFPKPVVVEMGGKNPAIVLASGDLEAAANGVARSAFGYGGQKCSACSRVYVEASARDEFTARLLAATAQLRVGDPLRREVFLGPLISARAVETFVHYAERAVHDGGEILAGGRVLADGDLAHGHFVEPTVVRLRDDGSPLFVEEMFVPILLVSEIADLDEGLRLANRAPYGLTAGLFSRDPRSVRRFLDGIEAGVVYVNRRSGATTGAWPGVNPFGGWKGSGSGGPAALGPWYLLKFLREQSRTINDVEL
jgi:1-pyrroline-5-carboxylate dehydrogenase